MLGSLTEPNRGEAADWGVKISRAYKALEIPFSVMV